MRKYGLGLGVVLALYLGQALALPVESTLPRGFEGFRGTLTGTVIVVFDYNQGFQMNVTKVTADADSKAPNPQAGEGKKLCVEIQSSTQNGKTVLDPAQRAWVKGLKEGQAVTVHVAVDGKRTLILQEIPKPETPHK